MFVSRDSRTAWNGQSGEEGRCEWYNHAFYRRVVLSRFKRLGELSGQHGELPQIAPTCKLKAFYCIVPGDTATSKKNGHTIFNEHHRRHFLKRSIVHLLPVESLPKQNRLERLQTKIVKNICGEKSHPKGRGLLLAPTFSSLWRE